MENLQHLRKFLYREKMISQSERLLSMPSPIVADIVYFIERTAHRAKCHRFPLKPTITEMDGVVDRTGSKLTLECRQDLSAQRAKSADFKFILFSSVLSFELLACQVNESVSGEWNADC